MKFKVDGRIFIVGGLLTVLGLVILGRLFFLQVVSANYYQTLAERQHLASLDLTPRRGSIFLKEKDGGLFPVANTKSGFFLFIDPRRIDDAEKYFKELSAVVPGLDREDFLERASKKYDPFEVVAKRLRTEEAEEAEELGLAGVGISSEEWRFYPARELASTVVGFTGYKGDDIVGRAGIEYFEEAILKGEENYVNGRRTLAGTFLDWGKRLFPGTNPTHDIVLTIEPQAQMLLEKILNKTREKLDAENAGGIVIDPKTGRILAMAASPSFDPNKYNEVKSPGVFVNPMVEHIYELGSVFKPLTMAAGLDTGSVSPETTYNDQGYLVIDGRRIENYDGKGRGEVDMQHVLNESLNTGAVFVMRQMGRDNLKRYFEKYGFYEKSGIALPGEVAGNLSNLESGREVEFATAAFGQGAAVTPLAFARAISSLANGGKLVRPFIIDRVLVDGAPDAVTEPEIKEGVLSPETSEEITRMLVKVVDEALVGGTVKNERYSIAAKTGTAQMPDPNGGGYADYFLHSFFGYAPAFDAKFAVFLFVTKPKGVRFASQTLTDPFMEIMDFLLSYYNIPPDR